MENVIETTIGTESTMFAAFNINSKLSFVRPYDPKSQQVTGMRHSVIRYRDAKGTASKPAKMVTVPVIELGTEYANVPAKAVTVLVGVLEDTQDAIIRGIIDADKSVIEWDAVNTNSVLEYLTAARISQRLTKEQVEGWANIALVDFCKQRAGQISSEKSHTEEQAKAQYAATLNAYVTLFAKLAAPVPNLGQESAIACKNVLAVAKLDDDMAKTLGKKLHAILNPVEANDGNL